jgi:hypothetical protein
VIVHQQDSLVRQHPDGRLVLVPALHERFDELVVVQHRGQDRRRDPTRPLRVRRESRDGRAELIRIDDPER